MFIQIKFYAICLRQRKFEELMCQCKFEELMRQTVRNFLGPTFWRSSESGSLDFVFCARAGSLNGSTMLINCQQTCQNSIFSWEKTIPGGPPGMASDQLCSVFCCCNLSLSILFQIFSLHSLTVQAVQVEWAG